MGYYARGNGSVTFIAWDEKLPEKISDILEEVFEIDTPQRLKENEVTICFWCNDKYYEDAVTETLKAVRDACMLVDGEIDYIGEDDSLWRFIYSPKHHGWIEQNGYIEYDPIPD